MTDHGPAGGSAPGAAPAGGAGAAVAPAPGRAPARGPRALRRQHQNVAERPFIVIWESTRACPLACLHCRAEAVTRRNPGELDTEAAEELLRQVAASHARP
ncbi:hypothetical protein ADZ36_25865, partial [Streptomyces fradiae]